MKGLFISCLTLAVCLLATPTLAESGSGSGWYDYFCGSAVGYAHLAEHCAHPVKQQLYYYLLYGSDVYETYSGDFSGLDGFSDWGYSGSGSGSGYSGWSGYWSGDDGYYSGWSGYSGSGSGWYAEEMDICGASMDWFKDCMSILELCDNELSDEIDDLIENYEEAICEDGELREEFEQFDGALTSEVLTTLESGLLCIDLDELFDLFLGGSCDLDIDDYEVFDDESITDVRTRLEGSYRETFGCIREEINEECDSDALSQLLEYEVLLFFRYFETLIPGLDVSYEEILSGFDYDSVDPREEDRSTTAVFGDPHIITYGSDDITTCAAVGERKYLQNTLVEIYGNNTLADEDSDSDATFMTSVSIEIFSDSGNTVAIYTAGDSELPDGFDELDETSDVEIDVRESDEYVIIKSVDAGVAVALTRFRHTYTMVVRMADSAYDISTGMLKACPADEIISIETSERRRRRRDTSACDGMTYPSACVYDIDVTGDEDLATGAQESIDVMYEDTEALDSEIIDNDDDNGVDAVSMSLAAMFVAMALAMLRL